MSTYNTFSEAWVAEAKKTLATGRASSPRGQLTLERRWAQFSVADPMSFPLHVEGRKFRHAIGVLEGLSLVGQVSVPEAFTSRVKHFGDFLDGGVFHGAYATRAHGALADAVELLKRDPDSRQAVISVFDSTRDLNRVKRDIPCTISIQFLLGSKLEMRVTMRSNDLWLGTPYDFTQFAILQATLAQALDVEPGEYVHAVGSLHAYQRDFERIESLGAPILEKAMPFPLWPSRDLADITPRARQLLLDPHSFGDGQPLTGFEAWCSSVLW
jgi:thymidylate synthase